MPVLLERQQGLRGIWGRVAGSELGVEQDYIRGDLRGQSKAWGLSYRRRRPGQRCAVMKQGGS